MKPQHDTTRDLPFGHPLAGGMSGVEHPAPAPREEREAAEIRAILREYGDLPVVAVPTRCLRALLAAAPVAPQHARGDEALREVLKNDSTLRSMLHGVMEAVRRCSMVEDEHGLCECARFIGTMLQTAAQVGTVIGAEYDALLAAAPAAPARDEAVLMDARNALLAAVTNEDGLDGAEAGSIVARIDALLAAATGEALRGEPFYKAIHEPHCAYRVAGAPHPCTCNDATSPVAHARGDEAVARAAYIAGYTTGMVTKHPKPDWWADRLEQAREGADAFVCTFTSSGVCAECGSEWRDGECSRCGNHCRVLRPASAPEATPRASGEVKP